MQYFQYLVAFYFFYKLLKSSIEFEQSLKEENTVKFLINTVMIIFSLVAFIWSVNI